MDIPLFASALTDADLRAAGVDDLEVQRMPAGSNPSWLSRQQWDRIGPLLGERVSFSSSTGSRGFVSRAGCLSVR